MGIKILLILEDGMTLFLWHGQAMSAIILFIYFLFVALFSKYIEIRKLIRF